MKKESVPKIFAIIIGALATLTLVFLGIVYFALYRPQFIRYTCERSEKSEIEFYGGEENYARHLEEVEVFRNLNPARMEITSFDGLKLSALLIPVEDQKGVVLCMHGFHSNPEREYAGLAKFYHDLGYAVVLPYERSHEKSEGKYVTFGINERRDCKSWVEEICRVYGDTEPIFIHGISMGCATVVMSTGLNLPINVRGIIADCGFTSPYEIILWTCQHRKYPLAATITKIGNWMTKNFAGFSLDEYSTYEALQENLTPILFISGTADETVPVEMTMLNWQACQSDKELYLIENAPHAVSWLFDTEKYKKNVADFMKKYGER